MSLECQTHMFSFFLLFTFLDKRNEFGVSLENLQTDSQIRSKLNCFHVFSILFFLDKRNEFGVSLENLQTLSKLIPNSLQTRMFSDFSRERLSAGFFQ